MASGVPVVVSNVASLSEVVGKAGILVDPYNTNSIEGGIRKVLSMTQAQYNTLVEAGIKQARKFSWEKTARETLQILEKAAK
ncbi:MAG: Glycosyltransferase [Candidatus Curtissbacteria bacterium GW2011_GWC1_44_33]|nr:MAG: Glycosyltransferase [Candidatus Curtissbacteria bacterium GW2011_GWC1_44_33]